MRPSRRDADVAMQVVEKFAQQWNRLSPPAGAPAGIGADLRLVMPQQLHHGTERELCLEPRGARDGSSQTWSLNDPLGDRPSWRLRRIRAADRRERIEGGGLLGHNPISAKTAEAPAQRFENGDRSR
jgi:hypothetical protein